MRRGLTAAITAAGLLIAGCGGGVSTGSGQAERPGSANRGANLGAASAQSEGLLLHGRPQAVEPVAGAAQPSDAPGGSSSGGTPPASAAGGAASAGTTAQPVSDAEVRRELASSGMAANPDQATLVPGGLAIAPIGAPAAVQAVIDAGNQIARLPYRFGGGHGTFEDSQYDCSGSLSFVLAAAGLLSSTMTSGELMSWGDPGPGKWITIFANAGHTFMYVAGLRFDTVALAETGSRWSSRSATERDGFAVRHPPGL